MQEVILATAGYDHSVRLWRVTPPGTCWLVLQHNQGQVNCLAISPDRTSLAAGGNPHIRVYNLQSEPVASGSMTVSATGGQPTLVLSMERVDSSNAPPSGEQQGGKEDEPRRNILAVAYLTCSSLIGVSDGGDVRMWDLAPEIGSSDAESSSNPVNAMRGPRGNMRTNLLGPTNSSANALTAVHINAVCAGGPLILYAAANHHVGCLRLYDVKTGRTTREWRLLSDPSPSSPTPSPPPIGNQDYGWQADEYITACALSVAGGLPSAFAGTSRGRVFVCEGESVRVLQPHSSYVTHLSVSPDQRHMLSTSADGTAQLIDIVNLSLVALHGHEKWVWQGTWSADSKYCLTCSTDMTAKLWSVPDPAEGSARDLLVTTYSGQHSKGVTCVALNDFPL